MALRRSMPERGGRRVALTRSAGAPDKNIRREPKKAPVSSEIGKRFAAVMPGVSGIRNFFSTTLIIAMVVFFVGAVCVGLVYTYSRLVSGEYFALRTLEIQGNSRASSREILEIADLANGSNTLALSISTVEESLSRHPWVEEVSVKRVLPGTLIIGVREKTPAFWVLTGGILHYADARGVLIAPVVPGRFESLPMLEVESGAEDMAAVLPALVKSLQVSRLPLNMGNISVVRLSSARAVELYVDDAHLKISIGLEGWTSNLRRLGRTLADLERRSELKDVREIRAQGANVWVERRTGFTSVRHGPVREGRWERLA